MTSPLPRSSLSRPQTAGTSKVHTPMPPVLGYINERLRAGSAAPSRGGRSASRPSTAASRAGIGSRPSTADTTIFNKKLKKNRTFLRDNEAAETVLPQPLPNGIPYVAQFTTFDDLIERNILQQTVENQVRLTTSEVKLMYEAKCLDQNLTPSWEREVRFMELLSSNCKGTCFSLRENGLGHACAEAITRVLVHNEYYAICDLSGNRFRDAGARCIAQLLLHNETLVHLSLKSNDIGHEGGEALARALEQNTTLTSLDLGGISGINRNHLGSQGAAAMGQMLAVNPVLAYLDVSSSGLGAEGIKLLARGFEGGGNTALIHVNFASNNLGFEGSAELGPCLESTRFQHLDLQRNALGDRGVAHIAHGIRAGTQVCDNLTELLLNTNNIREIGAKAIGRFLRGTTKLKRITLCDNPLGASVKYIADALLENRSVTDISISHCMITEKDIQPVAAALSKTSTLNTVDISKNRIGDGGAKFIADGIRKNLSINSLNLASNAIGDAGGDALAVMIRENKGLEELNIRQNLMSASGATIEEHLRRNVTLRKLNFSFNDFSYQAYTGINSSLARNQQLYAQQEVPRLSKQIEELGSAHTELFHIQEDIDLEKRGVREKTDECSRLRETINNNTDRRRRVLEELNEQLSIVQAEAQEKEEHRRVESEKTTNTIHKMEMKASGLRNKVESEQEKKEKAMKDAERVRKALKALHEQETEALRPLLDQYEKANRERNSDCADAKWMAENLMGAEARLAQLEKTLSVPNTSSAAAGSVNPSGGKPTLGGSTRRQSAKPRK